MKQAQLAQMIRKIVAEEVRRQLHKIVSEMYLRKIVSEQGAPVGQKRQRSQRKLSLEDTFEKEMALSRDEHIPEPMYNSDEGAYQQGIITRKNEQVMQAFANQPPPSQGARQRLVNERMEGPYASMFQGVVPTDQRGGHPGVSGDLPMIPPTDVSSDGRVVAADVSQYGEYFKQMNEVESSKTVMKRSPEAEMRRLEEQRARLDARKV